MWCRWISMIHYHMHWYIHKRTHSRQVVNIFLDFSLAYWVYKEEFCHLGLVATPFLYSLLFQVCHWAGSDAPVRAVHQRGGPTRRLGPPPIISKHCHNRHGRQEGLTETRFPWSLEFGRAMRGTWSIVLFFNSFIGSVSFFNDSVVKRKLCVHEEDIPRLRSGATSYTLSLLHHRSTDA